MAGSRVYMLGFDEGQRISTQQKLALGQIGQDRLGNRWSYVEFGEVLSAGQWVADRLGASLGVTKQEVGETRLTFDANLPDTYSHVGAYGEVLSGTTGGGQGFVVTEQLSSNVLRIRLLKDDDDRDFTHGGWTTEVSANATVQLYYPGGVIEGDGTVGLRARGVVQVDVPTASTDETKQYGWVQQSGIGVCRLATGVTAIHASHNLIIGAGGNFTSGARTATNVKGAAALTTRASATDLVLADIDIINSTYRVGGGGLYPVGYGAEVIS